MDTTSIHEVYTSSSRLNANAVAGVLFSMSEIPFDTLIMQQTGAGFPAIKTGIINPDCIYECRRHVLYMIGRRTVSHDKFSERAGRLNKIHTNLSFSEIVAYTSGRADNPQEAARIIFNLWRNSRGHNKVLQTECKLYGISLGFIGGGPVSTNNYRAGTGMWFSCGIFGATIGSGRTYK